MQEVFSISVGHTHFKGMLLSLFPCSGNKMRCCSSLQFSATKTAVTNVSTLTKVKKKGGGVISFQHFKKHLCFKSFQTPNHSN